MPDRQLTEEELEQVKNALIDELGYWNAVNLTNGFDLMCNEMFVFVKDYEDERIWMWDSILEINEHYKNIREGIRQLDSGECSEYEFSS